jgi:hypothetical protein
VPLCVGQEPRRNSIHTAEQATAIENADDAPTPEWANPRRDAALFGSNLVKLLETLYKTTA